MESVSCAVFDSELANFLGKKETDSDLEFYHRSHFGKILTFVLPNGFPEKINPLLQALHAVETVVLNVEKIDAVFGEIVVAIDSLEKKRGFLVAGENIDPALLEKIITGTVVEGFEKISKEEILDKIANSKIGKKEGALTIDLDGMFNVNGIGVIGLGFVKEGKLKKFDSLKALALEKDVVVKTIQVMDKDVHEAECNERIGISLKGIEVGDFSRGLVLTNNPEFSASKELDVFFEKNRFCRKEISTGMQLHLQCREQVVGAKILQISGNSLKIETSKPIAFRKEELVSLIDLDSKPRIIGKGKIQ